MDDLEKAAAKLKRDYPIEYHSRIDDNLAFVSQEMEAPGVSLQEAEIALYEGLPSLPLPLKKLNPSGKSVGRKKMSR